MAAGLSLIKWVAAQASLYLCAALDLIPAYELSHPDPDDGSWVPGRWYKHGCWGCRWHICRPWGLYGHK